VQGLGAGTSSIGRANLDGTGVDPNFIDATGNCGMALDGAHVYWSNTLGVNAGGHGSIGRANLDGAGVDQGFIPVGVNTHFDGPCGVAVYKANVYWAWGNNVLEGVGGIGRSNLGGGEVDQHLIPLGDLHPCGMALDGAHLYWADRGYPMSSIGRANLDGTGVDRNVIPAQGGVCGVAVDALSSPPSPPPSPAPSPSNNFALGTVTKNLRKGTAKLTVNVPGPGKLDIAETKKVKAG
jgi:hypothetical protein